MQELTSLAGKLIAIEGADGAGTTAQSDLLVHWLESEVGVPTKQTREPTDRAIGRLIRRVLRGDTSIDAKTDFPTLALLFAADRADHAKRVVEWKAEGACIVSDRCVLSSYVYQQAMRGGGHREMWLYAINRFAPEPDLTIVLDVSLEACRARRGSRLKAPEVYEVDTFQQLVLDLYAQAEHLVPNVVRVGGEGTIGETHLAIVEAVKRH